MSDFIINSNYINGNDNKQITIYKDAAVDWEAISALLCDAQKRLTSDSAESKLLQQAAGYCNTKNQSGFVSFLRQHAGDFFSGTMQNLLGGVLTQALMGLLA